MGSGLIEEVNTVILKNIVRFFKSTGTGYVPLDWAMFNHGFYKQQKDFQVPIAKWVDGLAVEAR